MMKIRKTPELSKLRKLMNKRVYEGQMKEKKTRMQPNIHDKLSLKILSLLKQYQTDSEDDITTTPKKTL